MKKKDKKKTKDLENQIKDWRNKYLRALSDYQNLEKRMSEKRGEEERFAIKRFILKLLPNIDDLERAEKTINNQGLSIVIKQFNSLLKEEEVEKIEVIDKEFDPKMMECVEVEEVDDKKDNKVVKEIRPGYKMRDKVLRVARVKVGKKSEILNPKYEASINDQNSNDKNK